MYVVGKGQKVRGGDGAVYKPGDPVSFVGAELERLINLGAVVEILDSEENTAGDDSGNTGEDDGDDSGDTGEGDGDEGDEEGSSEVSPDADVSTAGDDLPKSETSEAGDGETPQKPKRGRAK